MAEPTLVPKSRDFYAAMTPEADPELRFWALRKAGLSTTRSRRRGFRYFGLRISAVFLGLGGSLGVFLGQKFLGADVATLLALPLPAYGALALGTPALLELIRPEPPEGSKKKRSWSWLLFLAAGLVLALTSGPGKAAQSTWLIPLVLYLVISIGLRAWSRSKDARNQRLPRASSAPPPRTMGSIASSQAWRKSGARRPERREPATPTAEQALLVRGLGLSEAIFWLLSVGVLPAFALQAFVLPRALRGQEISLMALAVVFVLGVSGLLGALGTLAERLSPRFPRLVAALILFGPFIVSLAFPQFPNLVNAILAANAYIASEATSHFGLI